MIFFVHHETDSFRFTKGNTPLTLSSGMLPADKVSFYQKKPVNRRNIRKVQITKILRNIGVLNLVPYGLFEFFFLLYISSRKKGKPRHVPC